MIPGGEGGPSPLAGGPGVFNPTVYQQQQQQFINNLTNSSMAQAGLQSANIIMGQVKSGFGSNLEKFLPMGSLKYYFKVSNGYVAQKLGLILFPYTRSEWGRVISPNGGEGSAGAPNSADEPEYLPPRFDVNAPDLYIPSMAAVTYVIVCAFIMGVHAEFTPEVLGLTMSQVSAALVFEVILLKTAFYLLDVRGSLPTLDALAYVAYKFVPITITGLVGLLGSGLFWAAFVFTSLSYAVFFVRTLRLVMLPQAIVGAPQSRSHSRNYFLLGFGALELVACYLLSITSHPEGSALVDSFAG